MKQLGKMGIRSRPSLGESLLYVEEVPYGARHREVHGPQFTEQRAELGDRKSPLDWVNSQKRLQLL